MARPREFDSTQALEKAMEVFWAKGYEATSLRDLITAMGISKSSLYNVFGNKHELFLSTLDHYCKSIAARNVAAVIDAAPDARSGIAAVFAKFVEDLLCRGETCGCFAQNSAVEVALNDPDARARVYAAFVHMEDAIFRGVERGQAAGDITARHDPRTLARHLANSLQGLLVTGKANPDRGVLDDITAMALSALD
ncbi:MAG: TetR/AcrR family transcriptional regulator [Alphaproteobacteria bacterium]